MIAAGMRTAREACARYQALLTRRPVITNMTTSAALWASGDACVQLQSSQDLDFRRAAFTTTYGGLFIGPLGHMWYENLDTMVTSVTRLKVGGTPFLATKVAVDTLLWGPITLIGYMAGSGVVQGDTPETIAQRIQLEFWPSFLLECSVWPAVQAVNFKLVPVRHQLLVVNTVAVLDCAFLSWVSHDGDSSAPWPMRLVARIRQHWTETSEVKDRR